MDNEIHSLPIFHRVVSCFADVAQPTSLKLSSGLQVENSPGSRSGVVVCKRIHIHGLSRHYNLRKYAHSVRVKVRVNDTSRARLPNVEVCYHRNVSLGIGLCPQRHWEKLVQGSWVHSMSPYDTKLLDVRSPGSSLEIIEVSIEEEFMLYRVIFLALGVIMLAMAPCLSKSIVFYYSGAMAVGVILVILMVLFQGMRLLPSGRKNSLAIVIYSSLVGVGSFMLRHVPGLLHSLLVEIGISDDMYTPLVSLLLVCFILAGAWLGFCVVRKLVLTEDGDVDSSVALFVAWSIWILSGVMIIQSSLDPLLATEALVSGVLVSSLMRRLTKFRFSHLLPKHVIKAKKSNRRKSRMQDLHSEYLHDEFRSRLQRSEEAEFLKDRTERFTLASPNSPATVIEFSDLTKIPGPHSSVLGSYVSTFHKTPERKTFSKEEWDNFTRDFTKKGLEELVSSPEFNKWAVRNAERITLAPSRKRSSEQRSRWLPWL
ncbi:hypothetical protein AQUCO_06000041v1 [Aquilegia coerulea]|uniref:Nuclear envelope integral membrane protein 1 n=1 Tax=Aquilegia coerulea TaxID=218851 RepID=A0A2G5CDQ4_AQUCA|nr:hypothetical protein AQUCO_06000041v1 [Aquilegia coerulea]